MNGQKKLYALLFFMDFVVILFFSLSQGVNVSTFFSCFLLLLFFFFVNASRVTFTCSHDSLHPSPLTLKTHLKFPPSLDTPTTLSSFFLFFFPRFLPAKHSKATTFPAILQARSKKKKKKLARKLSD